MKNSRGLLVSVLLLTLVQVGSEGLGAGKYREVSDQLQLFLDDWLIESREGVRSVLHSPEPKEIVIRMDRPYEDSTMYDPTVILEGHRYRMWYRTNFNQRPFYTGYAESLDGIHWSKPNLGLVEYQGSTDNNLIWPVPGGRGFVLSIFKDANPQTRPEERYKAIGLENERSASGKSRALLMGLVSPDGLRWRQLGKEPLVWAPLGDPHFDSHNIVLWDGARGHYSIYARGWARHKVRDIRRFTSTDFRTWSSPTYLDMGAAPIEHLYKNSAIPYYRRPDIILMFPKRFLPERKFEPLQWEEEGLSDVVFMFSRDGIGFDRRFMEAFIRPGQDLQNWHERAIEMGPTLVPTGPDEMSLYYMEHFRSPEVQIRRGVLRVDGFVSLQAGYKGGTVLTRPLRFAGSRLELNYATSAAGSIRVEIQAEDGSALPGYSLDDSAEIFGDEVERTVTWKDQSDLSALAGRTIRLKFQIRDGDLYSMQFRP